MSGPTPEQLAAIEAREGDVFLQAGAGSGKTRVLVERYCEAIVRDGLTPDRILAFTFTERAAAQLRRRIRAELHERARAAARGDEQGRARELATAARESERAWVMTMHGFGRRILASHPVAAGLDPRFRVLDEAEAQRLRRDAVREALADLADRSEVTELAAAYGTRRLERIVLGAYDRLRSQGMTYPRLPDPGDRRPCENGAELPEDVARAARAAIDELLGRFAERYEELKRERSALDFADLELRTLELLRGSPRIGSAWRERFSHVMVDEFQDTNLVQLELVEALRGPETRVFVVGDENQSIYGFRDADLEVFRRQRQRARGDGVARLLSLRDNFRSEAGVLAAVNRVGSALLGEGFGELTAGATGESAAPGPAPGAELLLTLEEGRSNGARSWLEHAGALQCPPSASSPAVVAEARSLAARLRELVDDPDSRTSRGDIVVLLRAFTHVDAYEEALDRAGLDPHVVGGRGYWSQQQVEDLLCILETTANPLDDEPLLGALSSPACNISPDCLWLLRRSAGKGRHLWPVLEWAFGDGDHPPGEIDHSPLEQVPDGDRRRLRRFCESLRLLRARARVLALDSLVEAAMRAFDYDLSLLAAPDGEARMANVRKLMRMAREYEEQEGRELRGFLRFASERAERDAREGAAAVRAEDHDGVSIMTVHAAKGLEFGVVAVPDLGRALNAGHARHDIEIGRPDAGGDRRLGIRLALPGREPVELWDLTELGAEADEASAEEACRLVYVGATRARRRLLLSGIYRPAHLSGEEQRPTDSALRRLLPALAGDGWDGAEGPVELRPPGGAPEDGDAPPPRLWVRINEPGAERAGELAVRRSRAPEERSSPQRSPGSQAPPLLDSRRWPVPVGHLSYSALDDFARCGYRFHVERVIGLGTAAATGGNGRAARDRDQGLEFGNAAHAALERSARSGWERPSDRYLEDLAARHGLAGEAAERLPALIDRWLRSPLRASLEGAELHPETPFALLLGGTVVRGKIDLLVRRNGGPPLVIDFKTDALHGREAAALGERYADQRALYALAAAGPGPEAEVEAAHVFLEAPDEPAGQRFDEPGLREARARLEELIARIRGGEFVPAERPHPELCAGCPAAARLCPRPAVGASR